ncbi:MAG: hypothetical protein ACOCV1_00105 [Bacillota bacterium]
MALKLYKVSLKNGNNEVKVSANNADEAIRKAKKQKFYAFRNVNNSQFNARAFNKFKIKKVGIGKYSIYDTEQDFLFNPEGKSSTAVKKELKKLNNMYIKNK